MLKYEHLDAYRADELWWVTIDRKNDRNSINSDVIGELSSLMDYIEKSDARAIVFIGAGEEHFVGGADGIEMMQLTRKGGRAFSRAIQGIFNRIEECELITVAAIDGLCFGGGFELALACDLRVATTRSRIGLPEVKVGLIPGGGGTQRLPRLVGSGLAMQMILSGERRKH